MNPWQITMVRSLLKALETFTNNLEKRGENDTKVIQDEVENFVNNMTNRKDKWIPCEDNHDSRSVTLIVPIAGIERAVFLSFDV